jgi:hypothetical protein
MTSHRSGLVKCLLETEGFGVTGGGSSAEALCGRCGHVRLTAGPLPQFYGSPLFLLVKPFPVAQLLTKVRQVPRQYLPVIL